MDSTEEKKQYTSDELDYIEKKNKALKAKVIALHRSGLHVIKTNIRFLNGDLKSKVVILIEEIFNDFNENNDLEFNTIISDLFFNPDEDYTTYPIYQSIIKN
jgi:hypothetical protein